MRYNSKTKDYGSDCKPVSQAHAPSGPRFLIIIVGNTEVSPEIEKNA